MSLKVTVHFGIDYRAREKEPCALCGKPKDEHWPAQDFPALWCPHPVEPGRFTSMTFRRTVTEMIDLTVPENR